MGECIRSTYCSEDCYIKKPSCIEEKQIAIDNIDYYKPIDENIIKRNVIKNELADSIRGSARTSEEIELEIKYGQDYKSLTPNKVKKWQQELNSIRAA